MSAVSDQAYSTIQSISTTIDSGDALLTAFKYENAVTAYQAAGTQSTGLRSLFVDSPAIDALDTLDQQLGALTSNLASQQTAQQAQSLAKQILTGWQAQYSAASPMVPSPAAAATAPSSTPTSSGVNWLLWGLVAAGVGALGYFMLRGPRSVMANPLLGGGGPRRSKRGMISKGHSCLFELKGGRDVSCRGGMLHDPSGRAWPARSVLVGPFRGNLRRAAPDEVSPAARHYLGGSHDPKIGSVDTPPKDLGQWTYVGDVERIRYTRTGRKSPGRYQHPFNEGLMAMIHGRRKVRLYRRGRYYRLELPRGAMLDARGYVWP